MPTRRPLLKRVALWTGAVVLLLTWYPLGAPFAVYFFAYRFPAAMPAVTVLYFPLDYFLRHEEILGSQAYRYYVDACVALADETIQP